MNDLRLIVTVVAPTYNHSWSHDRLSETLNDFDKNLAALQRDCDATRETGYITLGVILKVVHVVPNK